MSMQFQNWEYVNEILPPSSVKFSDSKKHQNKSKKQQQADDNLFHALLSINIKLQRMEEKLDTLIEKFN